MGLLLFAMRQLGIWNRIGPSRKALAIEFKRSGRQYAQDSGWQRQKLKKRDSEKQREWQRKPFSMEHGAWSREPGAWSRWPLNSDV
jgi:hypothetical protein